MTREEAIGKWIYPAIATMWPEDKCNEILEALKQEPCEDCISRQAVFDELNRLGRNAFKDDTEYDCFFDFIDNLQSEQAKEKTGHWITRVKSDLRGDMWPTNPKCSECGGEPYYSNTIHSYKFCPYCGAKMESEVKE